MEIRIGSLSLTGVLTEGPGDLRIQPASALQVDQLIGAAGVNLLDLGNDQYTITFSVTREQQDGETAAFFVLSHIRTVRAVGVSICTYKTAEGTIILTPAFASVTDASAAGCRTFHTYRIICGAMVDTSPPGTTLTVY